jgi:hypothetical protein
MSQHPNLSKAENNSSQYLELSTYPAQIPEGQIARFMGVFIYSYLPPVMRPARISDLFFDTNELADKWIPRKGVRYLAESFLTSGHYFARVMKATDSFEELKLWFAYQKVWVKDETK